MDVLWRNKTLEVFKFYLDISDWGNYETVWENNLPLVEELTLGRYGNINIKAICYLKNLRKLTLMCESQANKKSD